tara:strand:+ start:2195 stop:2890 length:696 start_codon:yes stop_codon:yes gene_type:complete
MSEEPTAKEIWDKLSRIDVSEKVQKKGGLSYLSWAWAWATLMDNYPQAEYEFREFESPIPEHRTLQSCMFYPDGTGEVHCDVSVGEVRRYMWLPVMDFRNNAIAHPNSREISDAKMRCLTKCISMLGLGSHIYQGEDIPRNSNTDGAGTASVSDKKVAKKAPAKVTEKKANGAAGGVFYAHKAFIDQIETKDELIKHFEKNKAELAKLKKSKPDVVAKISQAFSEKMESFN